MMFTHTLRAAALASALALASAGASAAGFTFTGSTDSGLLAGESFSGSFSFDGTIPMGDAEQALTGFSLNFAGQSWTLASVDGGAVAIYAAGQFVGLSLIGGPASAAAPGVEFVAGFADFSEAQFAYKLPDAENTLQLAGFGSYTVSAVPEPASYALLLGGLAAVGAFARRQRRA